MRLLESGVDLTVIALWLGHEQVSTTTIYLNSQKLHQTGEETRVVRLSSAS